MKKANLIFISAGLHFLPIHRLEHHRKSMIRICADGDALNEHKVDAAFVHDRIVAEMEARAMATCSQALAQQLNFKQLGITFE